MEGMSIYACVRDEWTVCVFINTMECMTVKKDIEIQPGFEPGSSEF